MGTRHYPMAEPAFVGNERNYVLDCIDSSWVSSIGKYIEMFEAGLADVTGSKHAIACMNGTVALHLAMLANNIGPGDEVIVPSLTYVATANAVAYCGARPVFADVDPDSWTLDAEDVVRHITPRTKGIIAVHLFGHPCDMGRIKAIAHQHGLFVVEDAAEAIGAEYLGRPVGSLGDIGMFSFFGNKIITTGEGGAVTLNDDALSRHIRMLKGQGMDPDRRYWFPIIGYNYRMTNIQAAIGYAQLEKFEWHVAQRIRVANSYYSFLKDYANLFRLPVQKSWAKNVYWMYNVILTPNVVSARDDVIRDLAGRGVETRPMFYPMHTLPPYQHLQPNDNFPVSTEVGARGITLPTYSSLTTEDVEYIATQVIQACLE